MGAREYTSFQCTRLIHLNQFIRFFYNWSIEHANCFCVVGAHSSGSRTRSAHQVKIYYFVVVVVAAARRFQIHPVDAIINNGKLRESINNFDMRQQAHLLILFDITYHTYEEKKSFRESHTQNDEKIYFLLGYISVNC